MAVGGAKLMEHGFYHPSRGYWQAIGGDAAALLSMYPSGTIQVPVKPSADHDWQGGQWVYVEPAQTPAPVPEKISRRQFYQGLAVAQFITQPEALDAIRMIALPAALQGMVDGMTDANAKFEALSLLYGATEFYRDHPLTMIFAISQGISEAQVDQFWRDWFAL